MYVRFIYEVNENIVTISLWGIRLFLYAIIYKGDCFVSFEYFSIMLTDKCKVS